MPYEFSASILELQDIVRKVPVSDYVVEYAVDLVETTRPLNEASLDFIKKYVLQ